MKKVKGVRSYKIQHRECIKAEVFNFYKVQCFSFMGYAFGVIFKNSA